MPDGTYLDDVFVARVHKSNALSVKCRAMSAMEYYRSKVLALASVTPDSSEEGWADGLIAEVKEIMDEFEEVCVDRFLAEQIIEFPEDCRDELVEADWKKEESEDGEEA